MGFARALTPHRARWTILRRREEAIRDVVPRRGSGASRARLRRAFAPHIVRADASTSALASATSSSTLARRAASVAACTNHARHLTDVSVWRAWKGYARSAPVAPRPTPTASRPRDPRDALDHALARCATLEDALALADAEAHRLTPTNVARALYRVRTTLLRVPSPTASADAPPSTSSAATSVSPRSARPSRTPRRASTRPTSRSPSPRSRTSTPSPAFPASIHSDGPNATRSVASSATPSRASRADSIRRDWRSSPRGESPRTRRVDDTFAGDAHDAFAHAVNVNAARCNLRGVRDHSLGTVPGGGLASPGTNINSARFDDASPMTRGARSLEPPPNTRATWIEGFSR